MKYIYPETLYKKIYSEGFSIYGIYFKKIFIETVKILNNFDEKKTILDFGCGEGFLKKIYNKKFNNHKIINYDIIPEKTEVKDYNQIEYDILFGSHVFCLFSEKELDNFISKEINKNSKIIFIVAIGKQNFFSKFLQFISNNNKANSYNHLSGEQEMNAFLKQKKMVFKKSIFFLTDLVVFK